MEEQNSDEDMIVSSTIIGSIVIALIIACGLIGCIVAFMLSYVGALPWIF